MSMDYNLRFNYGRPSVGREAVGDGKFDFYINN